VLAALAGRFGGAVVVPLHPRDGAPAIRVLVRAVKGSRAPLELRPGLVLHGAGNAFRPRIAAVLRDGAALPLCDTPSAPGEGA
jgi:tRNA1(Val) A37 N6-methylase TrmN6